MPTYQYRCPSGHEFEKFERMTVKSRPKCPECGKRSERLISGGVGLVFKGSGFYATDYKRPHRGDKTTEGGKPGKAGKADKSAKPEKSETPTPPSSSSSGSE